MNNKIYFKRTLSLFFIFFAGCYLLAGCINSTTKAKQSKDIKVMKNPNEFITDNVEFKEYINNFNDILLPFNFTKTWKDIGRQITHKVEPSNQFLKFPIIQNKMIKSRDIYCAYKIPFNNNFIGLVYSLQDVVNHQIILVVYSNKGEAISTESIHGEFNDSEYKYSCILDEDLHFNIYDSVFVFQDGKMRTENRDFRKLNVNKYGKLIDIAEAGTGISNLMKDLIGIWHDGPVVSSGLGRTFTFYPDGSYKYRKAETDFLNRSLFITGDWEISGNQLKLSPKIEGVLEGGRVEFDVVSGDSTIEGGHILEKELKREEISYVISHIEFNSDFQKKQITLNKMSYYKINDDTNENYWTD